MLSVGKDIHFIRGESDRRDLAINFYGLEYHRSTSSEYGLSFLQKQRSLRIEMDAFLKSTYHLRDVASNFLDDSSSNFFAVQSGLGQVRDGWIFVRL